MRPRAATPRDRALTECAAGARALATGQTAAGLKRYVTAVTLAPQDADIAALHGVALRTAGRLQDAQRELIRAIALDAHRADSYLQLGHTFFMVQDYAQAADAFLAAATLRRTDAFIWRDAAEAMRLSHRLADGLVLARHAASLDDLDPTIANTLALLLHRTGALDEALSLCERIRSRSPGDRNLSLTHAMLLRTFAQHATGWALHERRLELPELTQRPNPPRSPRWDGSPLAQRHILVRGEQGLGDQVQFVRWATMLRTHGASRITVQCAAPLVRLLQTVPGVDEVLSMESVAPSHDVHADVMSLPHLLHTGDDLFGTMVPYLQPNHVSAALAARLTAAPRDGRLRLGLVWGGTPKHTEDRSRSMPLATLLPVLRRLDVQIVVLQQGPAREQLEGLPHDVRSRFVDIATDCADMADTAQVLTACDVVLSVDTAVAHVAGALGVPTWVMVAEPAEWRWGRDRSDCPYYPHTTVLRQASGGDWSAVVHGAMQAIDAWHLARR
jgi:Flp pilus assembly protein TadD/ADP-heptose:LPS heptosyltransferase